MAFWGKQDLKEPLRQNRWFLRFGTDLDQFTFALKECKKPEYEIGVTEHRLLTHTLRYPTLLKWKPIDIKFVSARAKIEPKTSFGEIYSLDNLFEIIGSQSGYVQPTDGNHQQISKVLFSQALSGDSLELIQINANGQEIEVWLIKNPFISNVNYGTLSYENEAFVEVSCTIQYDWAEIKTDKGDDNESKKVNPGFPGK
jgi:hypothetical protein